MLLYLLIGLPLIKGDDVAAYVDTFPSRIPHCDMRGLPPSAISCIHLSSDGSLVHARHTLTAVSTLYATNDAEDPPVDATFTAGERKVSGIFKGLAGFSSCTVSVDVWKQDFAAPEAFVTMTTANGVPFHEVCQTDQAETGDGGFYRCADAVEISSCLLYTSPSPRDATLSRMPSSA